MRPDERGTAFSGHQRVLDHPRRLGWQQLITGASQAR